MKLELTSEEARFLLCAASDLDITRSAYKNIPDIAELQRTISETLRGLCWNFHCEEQQEKETARLQIEIACKRWPDIIKVLNR